MLRATPRYVVALFLTLAVALHGRALAGGKKPLERRVGSIVITGELEDRAFLTFEQFEALPLTSHNVSVMFQAGQAMVDYQAIVAWGKFDPGFENKPIVLAVT